jgi:hypothetical protein
VDHGLEVAGDPAIGLVLQEQQAEADVLVLGRVHRAAQGVGHLPELGFVADGGSRGGRTRFLVLGGWYERENRIAGSRNYAELALTYKRIG